MYANSKVNQFFVLLPDIIYSIKKHSNCKINLVEILVHKSVLGFPELKKCLYKMTIYMSIDRVGETTPMNRFPPNSIIQYLNWANIHSVPLRRIDFTRQ